MNSHDKNEIERYLLGELADDDTDAFEARYFAQPSLFDQILQVESDLVDDYARERLSERRRELFRSNYLKKPHLQERAKFAWALAARIDSSAVIIPTPTRWRAFLRSIQAYGTVVRLSAGFAALVLVATGVAFLVLSDRKNADEVAGVPKGTTGNIAVEGQTTPPSNAHGDPVRQANATPRERPKPDATPRARPADRPEPPPAPQAVSLALQIGGVRGSRGSTPVMVIPKGTGSASLILNVKDLEQSAYLLTVEDLSGGVVAGRTVQHVSESRLANLTITVPANKLASGEYILKLTRVGDDGAADDLSKSLFRVRKQN